MDGISHDEAAQALRRELAEARAELAAARRQQAASAEVLRIVSRSSADAAPVFDAILDACLRLFSPYGAAIYLVDGEMGEGRGAARLCGRRLGHGRDAARGQLHGPGDRRTAPGAYRRSR